MNFLALFMGLAVERLLTQLFHLRKFHWLDPLFDLAVICEGDALDPAERDALLEHYLPPGADRASASHALQLQSAVYRELDRLWSLATGR